MRSWKHALSQEFQAPEDDQEEESPEENGSDDEEKKEPFQEFYLVGGQHLKSFHTLYQGQRRDFVILSEYHGHDQLGMYDCAEPRCQSLNIQARMQEEFRVAQEIGKLYDKSSKIKNFEVSFEKMKRLLTDASRIFKTSSTIPRCLLLSTLLIYLATHATETIDIFIEMGITNRNRHYTKDLTNKNVLAFLGNLFAFCEKGGQISGLSESFKRKLCSTLWPTARLHGVDLRESAEADIICSKRDCLEYLKQKTTMDIISDWLETYVLVKERPHSNEFPTEMQGEIKTQLWILHNQFRKSVFASGQTTVLYKSWMQAMVAYNKTDPYDQHNSTPFDVEAVLVDLYAILRMFNATWNTTKQAVNEVHHHSPKNILYYAGYAHTHFLELFLMELDGMEVKYDNWMRMSEKSKNCITLQLHELPFVHLLAPHLIRNHLQNFVDEKDDGDSSDLLDFVSKVRIENPSLFEVFSQEQFDAFWTEKLQHSQIQGVSLWIIQRFKKELQFRNSKDKFMDWFLSRRLLPREVDTDTIIPMMQGMFYGKKQVLPDKIDLSKITKPTFFTKEWAMRYMISEWIENKEDESLEKSTFMRFLLTARSWSLDWKNYVGATFLFENINAVLYELIHQYVPPSLETFAGLDIPLDSTVKIEKAYESIFSQKNRKGLVFTTMKKLYVHMKSQHPNHRQIATWCGLKLEALASYFRSP